jgi:hypothetical protein
MRANLGQQVIWQGQYCQVVDPEDTKLHIATPISEGITLIVAANGQLVWVRDEDLED